MAERGETELAVELQPLNDHLLLRPILPEEIPEDAPVSHGAHARAEWGEVIAAGDHVASRVSRGDRVAFRPSSAIAIALSGRWFAMAKSTELLAVMRKKEETFASVTAAPETAREAWAEPAYRASDEPLETDVAPDLLDHAEPTAEDLH